MTSANDIKAAGAAVSLGVDMPGLDKSLNDAERRWQRSLNRIAEMKKRAKELEASGDKAGAFRYQAMAAGEERIAKSIQHGAAGAWARQNGLPPGGAPGGQQVGWESRVRAIGGKGGARMERIIGAGVFASSVVAAVEMATRIGEVSKTLLTRSVLKDTSDWAGIAKQNVEIVESIERIPVVGRFVGLMLDEWKTKQQGIVKNFEEMETGFSQRIKALGGMNKELLGLGLSSLDSQALAIAQEFKERVNKASKDSFPTAQALRDLKSGPAGEDYRDAVERLRLLRAPDPLASLERPGVRKGWIDHFQAIVDSFETQAVTLEKQSDTSGDRLLAAKLAQRKLDLLGGFDSVSLGLGGELSAYAFGGNLPSLSGPENNPAKEQIAQLLSEIRDILKEQTHH